jgi:carbamoyltransferase
MLILGINSCSHDASLSVIENGEILFAGHSERYSKKKNDSNINDDLLSEALSFGKPEKIAYYEKPALKAIRKSLFGGFGSSFDEVKEMFPNSKISTFKHHYSHACAGYFTSNFDDAVVVVLDAIGEFETSSIWVGEGNKLKKIYSDGYPFSFGLFYTAFTQLVGLKPNEEEYIMMGMAAYGNPGRYFSEISSLFPSIKKQIENFHYGVKKFAPKVTEENRFDIAAAVQAVYEQRLIEFMSFAKKKSNKKNLVFMGGCALNCSANTRLLDIYDQVWIMPNPGDAGSSLGAAAALFGKHLSWDGPYLGTDIQSEYPISSAMHELSSRKVAAVASGKAEYGPRALGNRSIFADPRDNSVKDLVNTIKGREMFRPFAPVVLEEKASKWFDIDRPSPYMQYAVKCKKPNLIPSVVHKDGTSRVQTVSRAQHPGLYDLLIEWEKHSGIPVLLNTSLNIKGQPLINDKYDVLMWNAIHKSVQICNTLYP